MSINIRLMDKVNATFERLNATGSHLVGKIYP